MNTTHSRGFTLIELLVVIAIIGILSSVVLASLNQARSKGNDAAIMADIDGIRNQAQLYYDDHQNYGVPTSGLVESSCAATDNLFNETTIARQIAAADTANGTGAVVCNDAADGLAYAVSAALVTTPGKYYCIDSTGVSTTTTTALGATATACPQ